jgi:hypothetical protein
MPLSNTTVSRTLVGVDELKNFNQVSPTTTSNTSLSLEQIQTTYSKVFHVQSSLNMLAQVLHERDKRLIELEKNAEYLNEQAKSLTQTGKKVNKIIFSKAKQKTIMTAGLIILSVVCVISVLSVIVISENREKNKI